MEPVPARQIALRQEDSPALPGKAVPLHLPRRQSESKILNLFCNAEFPFTPIKLTKDPIAKGISSKCMEILPDIPDDQKRGGFRRAKIPAAHNN
jgi:hypothetical protein